MRALVRNSPTRCVVCVLCSLAAGCASISSQPLKAGAGDSATVAQPVLSQTDDAFLEDLSRRTFMFFWEQVDPETGIIRDRARTDGSPPDERARDIGSIA